MFSTKLTTKNTKLCLQSTA